MGSQHVHPEYEGNNQSVTNFDKIINKQVQYDALLKEQQIF